MLRIETLPEGYVYVKKEDILTFGQGITMNQKPYFYFSLKTSPVLETEISEQALIQLVDEMRFD